MEEIILVVLTISFFVIWHYGEKYYRSSNLQHHVKFCRSQSDMLNTVLFMQDLPNVSSKYTFTADDLPHLKLLLQKFSDYMAIQYANDTLKETMPYAKMSNQQYFACSFCSYLAKTEDVPICHEGNDSSNDKLTSFGVAYYKISYFLYSYMEHPENLRVYQHAKEARSVNENQFMAKILDRHFKAISD